MDEEKKPEPPTGQRRLESQYAKYEGKFLMLFVFLTMGTAAFIGLVFVEIYIPAKQKKEQQARADLEVLAQAANAYRYERGAFPDSIEELVTLSHARRAEGENALSLKDPWKQKYYYFKVSDAQAVCASSGRNRRLDLDLKDLSPPSEYDEHCIRARGDEIFTYSGDYDDWVILAGSWPSSE